MNKHQQSFLRSIHISKSNIDFDNLRKTIRTELYSTLPDLRQEYSVFGPFKRNVLNGIKRKTLTPVDKTTIRKLTSYLERVDNVNNPTDVSPYVVAYQLGFIDSIIIAKSLKSKYLLEQFLWRIFYYQANVDDHLLRDYDIYKWSVDKELQRKFFRGETGYDLIDAAIHCLIETGKMTNKVRMTVASFFCKNMLQPWMDGEKFFAKYLEDYDEVINRGNWIWCSQIRFDNQIFIRFLKPEIQLKKLLKTKEGQDWYNIWKVEKKSEEIIDWNKSCDRYRKWKRSLRR